MQRNNTRRESRNIAGRFRGGKLAPVLATPFLGGEGGVLQQTITMELDPVAGRLITPVTAQLFSVYVPVQAIDAERDRDSDLAGLTEVIRQKLLTGNPLFGLETEHEVSKRLGVVPVSMSGVKQVSVAVRLAHNAAVNYLRRRLYTYASLVPATNTAVTPALLSSTVLSRFNAALDPDEHINGSVQLNIPNMQLPVEGIGFRVTTSAEVLETDQNFRETGKTTTTKYPKSAPFTQAVTTGGDQGKSLHSVRVTGTTGANARSDVFAVLNGASAGGVSLTDFYNAQKMDQLTREMRNIADSNPIDGEDMVLRWAYGLSVDPGRHPFILHESERVFGQTYAEAQDGTGLMDEVALSKNSVQMSFTVPVPRTELGGIVLTFASVKPDETIANQPHPILSAPWKLVNQVADELKADPVPVTMREINASVASASENTVSFYTGHNELKKAYVNYGFNRQVDPSTVASKTAIWQLDLPASVTPENIFYPADISHYPFLDQEAEICTYAIQSEAVVKTPIFFGPSPVETVSIIDDAELFDEV